MKRETRIIMEKTGDSCPTCKGELIETYSVKTGFCPRCMKHVKIG